MKVERVDQLSSRDILPSQEVEIIGTGSIGDKARQLINKENQDYVLIFAGRLTSKSQDLPQLTYSHFNQASVLLEGLYTVQSKGPIEHFGGLSETTDKLFAILDDSPEAQPAWDLLREKNEYGLFEFQEKIRVVGSERKNRLVVFVEG